MTKDEVESWIKDQIWVVYALERKTEKKMQIAIGMSAFRVLHGKEIIYEGIWLADAIEKYNAITSPPDLNDSPKLDN